MLSCFSLALTEVYFKIKKNAVTNKRRYTEAFDTIVQKLVRFVIVLAILLYLQVGRSFKPLFDIVLYADEWSCAIFTRSLSGRQHTSSWCQGLAATSGCGTSLNFLFTFFCNIVILE